MSTIQTPAKSSNKYLKFFIRLLFSINVLAGIFYFAFISFLRRDDQNSSMSALDIAINIIHGTISFIMVFAVVFCISYVLMATLYFLYSFIRQIPWPKVARPIVIRRLPRATVLRPKVTLGTSFLIMLMAVLGFKTLLMTPDIAKIEIEYSKYKEAVLNTDDPTHAYNEYVDKMADILEHLSQTTTGTEKQIYQTLADLRHEQEVTDAIWQEAFEAIQLPRILDFSLLTTDEEFDFQRNVIKDYVNKSEVTDTQYRNRIFNFKERLQPLIDEDNEFVRAFLENVIKSDQIIQPKVASLMQAHVEYGGQIIQLLDFLQANKDNWDYDGELLLFADETLANQFNDFIEMLLHSEATINTLSDKVMKSM